MVCLFSVIFMHIRYKSKLIYARLEDLLEKLSVFTPFITWPTKFYAKVLSSLSFAELVF